MCPRFNENGQLGTKAGRTGEKVGDQLQNDNDKRCPIRNFLRARGSADRRTLNWLCTASGQEIHDNVRVPDEIQKDLRASEWLIRS